MTYQLQPSGIPIVAKQAYVTQEQPLLNLLAEKYGRNPQTLCVKVFYGNPLKEGEKLEDALWGDNHNPDDKNQVRKNCKLFVGTTIQNWLWWHGLTPRVYAIFEAGRKGYRVACQLTDYLGEVDLASNNHYNPKKITELHDKINRYGKEYHFSEVKDLLGPFDVLNDRVVDLQQYDFDLDVKQRVIDFYSEKCRYGKVYYQDVPELGLRGGPRKSEDRIKYLQLDLIDFKDKVVWDVGSAGGFFCRYALSRGAKIVYGFDEANPCHGAFILSNYLGAFNIDYVTCDLSKGIPNHIPKPDIALLLSMNFHIPIPLRVFEAKMVVFEDNGKESRKLDTLGKPWTDHFTKWGFVGRSLDHGDKAIYHIFK